MFRVTKRLILVLILILALLCFLRCSHVVFGNARPGESRTHPLHSSSSSVPGTRVDHQITLGLKPEFEDSIRTAVLSFISYGTVVSEIFRSKRSRFDKLSNPHRSLADTIGYSQHFQTAQRAADANTDFAKRIAAHAMRVYNLPSDFTDRAYDSDSGNENSQLQYSIVDDAFGHLVRDWSQESHAERAQVFPPILNALNHHLVGARAKKRVLLPGFGLGRLAHEIADRGYNVEACELDYSAILAYHYILSGTNTAFEHTLYPFVTHWTHQLNATMRFQPVRIPDKIPSRNVKVVEGDFLKEYREEGVYDAVVTLFFIDMSVDIIDFLETIWRILKVGGLWVNLGPLKWTQRSQMQLSAEEIIQLSNLLGLQVDRSSYRAIDTTYAHQPDSLLKFTYVTQFWTAKKHMRDGGSDGR